MISNKAIAFIGLFAAGLAAAPCEAGCHGVRGTVTGVRGDPASAELTHDNQTGPVTLGQRLCGGDVLVARPGTTIFYNTVENGPARISGTRVSFPYNEAQADSALDADAAADNSPH